VSTPPVLIRTRVRRTGKRHLACYQDHSRPQAQSCRISGSRDVLVTFRPMLSRPRIVELLAPHCDIATRLAAVPPTACVRGIYFRSALEEITRRGLRSAFETVIHETERSAFMLYPATDYIVWIAWAGSLVTSPVDVHAGMRELLRGNAVYFGQSLLGRSLIRLLARDPVQLMHQAIKSKRAVSNYGRWFIADEGRRHVVVRHESEYVWIESALLGAALGALESCGVSPTVEVRLQDRFNGDLVFRW
jgi:uncharacterized protein (TIGR02265 family)